MLIHKIFNLIKSNNLCFFLARRDAFTCACCDYRNDARGNVPGGKRARGEFSRCVRAGKCTGSAQPVPVICVSMIAALQHFLA